MMYHIHSSFHLCNYLKDLEFLQQRGTLSHSFYINIIKSLYNYYRLRRK